MAIPSYMRGLLNDEDSLLPSAGLLGAAAGNSPIPQALAQMAQQKAAPQQGPVASPRVMRGSPAAPMEMQPPKPLMSPTSAGLLSGGIAALEANPGSAYTGPGPVVAAALKAGLSSYVAGKQQEQESKVATAQAERFRTLLQDPDVIQKLGPVEHKFIAAMQPGPGMAQLQKALERKREVSVVGKALVDNNTGDTVFKGKEDPLSADGVLYDPETLKPLTKKQENRDPGKDFTTAVRARGYDFDNLTAEQLEVIRADIREANKSKGVHVSQEVKSGDSFAGGLGTGASGILKEEAATASGLLQAIPSVNEALRALDDGIKSGSFANARLGLGRMMNTLRGENDDETVQNTERFLSQMAEITLPFAKLLRPFSNSDRDFLMQAKGGNITWDAKTIRRILNIQKTYAREVAEKHNKKVDRTMGSMDPAVRETFRVDTSVLEEDEDETALIGGKEYPVKMGRSGENMVFYEGKWIPFSSLKPRPPE